MAENQTTITSSELASRLSARGVSTTVEQARGLLQRFAVERVVEPVAPDRWALTAHGTDVTAGLRWAAEDLR